MKQEKYILDKYLKDKVEETNLPFEEAHWQKALQALEGDDGNSKKVFPWWRTLIITGILLLSGLSLVVYNNLKNKSNNNITKADKINGQTFENKNKINDSTIIKPNSECKIESKNNVEENITTKTNNNKITTNQNESSTQEKHVKNTSTIISKPIINNEKNNDIKAQENVNSNIVKEKPKKHFIAKVLDKIKPIINVKKQSSKKINDAKIAVNNDSTITNTYKKEKEILETHNAKSNKNIVQNLKSKLIKKKKEKENVAVIKPEKNTITTNENSNQSTENTDQKIASKPKIILPVEKTNPRYIDSKNLKQNPKPKSKYDDDWTTVKSRDTILVNKKDEPKSNKIIFEKTIASPIVMVQGSIANAPKSTNNSNVWKPAPYIGFGYVYPITNRLDIYSNIGFTILNGLNYNYTTTKYTYGFGYDSSVFSMQNKSLYQLNIPLTLGYKIDLKQEVQVGIGANISLDVLSNVKDFGVTTSSNTWGYRNGYNSFSPYITVGYQYQIFNRWFAQVLYQQGLTDITNNNYFNNNLIDRNSRLNIGITYKLR